MYGGLKTVKFNVVQAWIDNVAYSHSKSAGTERNYRTALKRFCSFIESSPEQIVADYQTLNDKDFRRHYAEYLRALIGDMTKNGFASTTINVAVAGVRSFFKYNDLPLGFIPVGKNRVKYHNRDIERKEIAEILRKSKPRDRAFFCMMAQTGLRPSTIANLRLKHIEPEFNKGFNPCKIDVPEELSKGEFGLYFTFMPDETIKHLKDYLDLRDKLGPEDWLFTCEGVDKKLNVKSMAGLFFRAVNKLGLKDLKQEAPGKPRNVRLYCLRKFFRKYAGQAGLDFVNFWMGHTSALGVDLHYFSRDVEFHRQQYILKAMPNLTIESPIPLEQEVRIKQQNEEIEKLKNTISKIQPVLDLIGSMTPEVQQNFITNLSNIQELIVHSKPGTEQVFIRFGDKLVPFYTQLPEKDSEAIDILDKDGRTVGKMRVLKDMKHQEDKKLKEKEKEQR